MIAQVLIVCPHCHAPNRLPVARRAEGASCGRCHQPLFVGKPIDLGLEAFSTHHNRSDLPLLIDFWAPWCGPCQIMAPQFERAAVELEPHVRLAKVNTQLESTLAKRHDIRSIPTLVLFKKRREVARQTGAMSANDIVGWTRKHLDT